MKVAEVRLHAVVWDEYQVVRVFDQGGNFVFKISWGKYTKRTKPQAIAIVNRLCDRFNSGQEKK